MDAGKTKFRYNRTFKSGIVGIVLGFLITGLVFASSIIAKIQYDSIVPHMKTVDARIVDIDIDAHINGPHVQEIYITYTVDGVIYTRELKTDTPVSFAPGTGTHYSIDDKIEIFYDPQNPEVIACSQSVTVGSYYLLISFGGLALIMFALFSVLKHRRSFLVTQEEYQEEREERIRIKQARKKKNMQLKIERKQKYAKARRGIKIILIILSIPLGVLVLFFLFGLVLIAIGYGS